MPSITPHMVVATEVAKLLNINSEGFIRGNFLPDIIDIKNSHHKVESGIYMIPDIDYFIKKLDLTNDLDLGYLTHLLLDKHYLEDYLKKIYPNKNIFLDKKVYKDYDVLNHLLVKKFNLDVEYIEKALMKYNCKIKEEKLKYNINCLKNNISGKTYYLNINSFSKFLKEVSKTISEELIEYANKSS